jgi:hypothetical protein
MRTCTTVAVSTRLSATRWCQAVFAVISLPVVGCWGDGFGVAEVTGRVTIDGTPRKGLMVVFSPNDGGTTKLPPAYGFTNDEGRYRAIRPGSKPGAVVGQTTVRVLAFDGSDVVVNGKALPNTEMQQEIVRGPNVVDIDLSSK